MIKRKVNQADIIAQYKTGVHNYERHTKMQGLWKSEKEIFMKYLKVTDRILDLGCGTGRTTFPLYKLGYQNIVGRDLSPDMIAAAQKLNAHFGTALKFAVGDATDMEWKDNTFDVVLFAFNGMMSIPHSENRLKACREILRVLKPKGTLIFTTHDRDQDPQFFEFWKKEQKKWADKIQDESLFEFGDIIVESKNEENEIYLHIPDRYEIEMLLQKSGFELLDTFYRSERFRESLMVQEMSGDCRFWIAKKA